MLNRFVLIAGMVALVGWGFGQQVQNLTPAQLNTWMVNGTQFQLVDLRGANETNDRLENSIIKDYNSPTFSSDIESLNKNQIVVLYCQSGTRSSEAAPIFVNAGFSQVYQLQGGMDNFVDKMLAH